MGMAADNVKKKQDDKYKMMNEDDVGCFNAVMSSTMTGYGMTFHPTCQRTQYLTTSKRNRMTSDNMMNEDDVRWFNAVMSSAMTGYGMSSAMTGDDMTFCRRMVPGAAWFRKRKDCQ